MKTSILFWNGYRPERAIQNNEECPEQWTHPTMPRFVEAHIQKGTTVDPMRGFKTTPYTHKVSDSITLTHSSVGYLPFKRGICDDVRIVREDYIQKIDALDKEIERLKQQHKDLLEEAWRRAKPVTLEYAKEHFGVKHD